MSQYLQKYRLKDKGKSRKSIVLPANDLGDPYQDIKVEKMTDRIAAILFNRKDGRGKEYVEEVPQPAPEKSASKK
ncbi:MAG: hypothetical protein AAFP83_17075 [Bacteroidota bacterium]